VRIVKLVVERYIKLHEIDIQLLGTYQRRKHAPKSLKDEGGGKEKSELPTIDKAKKKQLKKFFESNVETSISSKCRDIVEYFFSVYSFQFLSRYSPLGVLFHFFHNR
jgi:hypothetical protein